MTDNKLFFFFFHPAESQRDPLRMPSLQEKMQLTHDLFLLDNDHMLQLLRLAESDCPAALARSIRGEEVLLIAVYATIMKVFCV